MLKNKSLKISVIGRPNVGKSTLVNRLVGRRVCIVGEEAGITRDRKYLDFEWESRPFTIIDTGGITFDKEDQFASSIKEQALAGVGEADAVVFLVDVTSGITKYDAEIAEMIRKEIKIPVYLAVNKVDSPEREPLIYDFYQLGFEKLYPISALHGSQGLSQMLTEIADDLGLQKDEEIEQDQEVIKVAIVGKPNVGKSSLFNKLVGTDRSIVSDHSGTTRDTVDMRLQRYGQVFELVDTAGLRRKAKINDKVERFSTIRSTHAIAGSDVAVLIVDGTDPEIITDQDQKIASLMLDRGTAAVILVNKWDALNDDFDKDNEGLSHEELQAEKAKYLEKFKKQADYKFRFISWAPKQFISAKTGRRTDEVWEMIKEVNEQHKRRVSTSILNKVLADILMYNPPPLVKQKSLNIKYVTQVGTAPPEFLFFCNYPDMVPESYQRFLESQMRQYLGFQGTPIRIRFASSAKK